MLSGKNAIITGARKGIGLATVEVFAKNGANVWACARKEDAVFQEKMEKIASECGVWIKPVYFDLMNENEVKNAVQSIVREKKQIDILVNNAGDVQYDMFAVMPLNNLRDMFENNYVAPLYLTQLVSRKMGRNGTGAIIFLSSIAGLRAETSNLAYGGSKAAIAHAVGVLSREMAQRNIRVNGVAPGMVDTDMQKAAEPQYWEQLIEQTNLKRVAKPDEIANVIAFLASDMASYVNGQVIRVDGGMQ